MIDLESISRRPAQRTLRTPDAAIPAAEDRKYTALYQRMLPSSEEWKGRAAETDRWRIRPISELRFWISEGWTQAES